MAMSAEEINTRAAGELHESATDLRAKFIRDVFEVTTETLSKQDEELDALAESGYQDGSILEYWVLEDYAALPFSNEEPQKALVTKIIKEDYGVDFTVEEMTLFLPIKDEVTLDEHTDLNSIQQPGFVVVRRSYPDGIEAWYIVRQDGIIPYVPEEESGGETTADSFDSDDITDELIARQLLRRTDTGISTIARLREDFVNFTQVIQRRVQIINGEYVLID
ncbi:MAG TPA: hypothetical protein PJ984_02220 [Candidatus Saccharibacteria bacterium]|jgi:hypothetical protein|nr:hypothetical protein [Candidatus Saccharibacteria bacterium]